jgi:tetratricopeptide (TPR) repeat protein
VSWAVKHFNDWYGKKITTDPTYGQLLSAVSKHESGSKDALKQLFVGNYPTIIKASVLEQYNQISTPQSVEQVKNFLQNADPLLRLNALHTASNFPAEVLLPTVTPILSDPILSVRTEAMNILVPYYSQLDQNTKRRFDAVVEEYLTIQRFVSDRPEGYLNQGIILSSVGRSAEAEQIYLLGLRRFPTFIQFYANLADFYRSQNLENKSREYLDRGLQLDVKNASLHYAMGLWLIRNKEKEKALIELNKANQFDPTNPTFAYGYAIGIQSIEGSTEKAIMLLENHNKKYGNDPLVMNALASFYEQTHQSAKANEYVQQRKEIFGY